MREWFGWGNKKSCPNCGGELEEIKEKE